MYKGEDSLHLRYLVVERAREEPEVKRSRTMLVQA